MQDVHQKTQNFMLISKLLKKLQKDSCEKSDQRKSDRIMEFLPFITLCKSVQPIFFFFSIKFCVL